MHNITAKDIKDFEEALRNSEKAEATIEKYVTTLRKLSEWIGGEELTKQKIIKYREHLLKSYTAWTVNGAMSAVNKYLEVSGMDEYRVKLLKVQRRMFRPEERELNRAEYKRLIETAETEGKIRLKLIMETICATGIRVSEVKHITVEAAQGGKVEISLKGKVRTILIPNKLRRKLLKYAKEQKVYSGEIFVTREGTSVSRKWIWSEMKKICEAANVNATKVFPHNLRHLFAKCFYSFCHDVVRLADVLGHSSVETTRIYLMSTGKEYERTLDRMSLVS